VSEFLSEDWRRALAHRIADIVVDTRIAIDVVVQREGDEIGYQVRLTPEGTSITDRPAGPADLTLVLSEEGARALAESRANAQELLATGALKLRGDLGTLFERADAFDALRIPD